MKTVRLAVRSFHEDEEGMEAIQVVAIFAIAAIVLIFVKTVAWPQVQKWMKSKGDELVN
jgi:Flp pilus assembly pilin Flp